MITFLQKFLLFLQNQNQGLNVPVLFVMRLLAYVPGKLASLLRRLGFAHHYSDEMRRENVTV